MENNQSEKITPTTRLFAGSQQQFTPTTPTTTTTHDKNKIEIRATTNKQTKSRAYDLGFGVYPTRRRSSSSSSSNDAAKVGICKLRTYGLVFWSFVCLF
jgi:hypothetical protein